LRGKGKVPMVPLSQTMFSPRLLGTYEFVKDGSGASAHAGALGGEVLTACGSRSPFVNLDRRIDRRVAAPSLPSATIARRFFEPRH
jgi:hypothetical protein